MEREGLLRLERERKARTEALASIPRPAGARGPLERIEALVDAGTMFEISAMATSQLAELRGETPADGVHAGFGRVAGHEVAILADDPEIIRRTDGTVGRNKRLRLLMHALHGRVPLVYLADGGGSHQATMNLAEGRLLGRYSDRSIVVPELEPSEREAPFISVLLGACSGQEAILVNESDVTIAIPGGGIALAPGEAPAPFDADVTAANETDAIEIARRLITLIPEQRSSALDPVAPAPPEAELPDDAGNELTAKAIVPGIFDHGSFVDWTAPGATLLLGVGRIEGYPVACILGDETASGLGSADLDRVARMARFCGRLALPLLLIQNGAAYGDEAARAASFMPALGRAVAALHDAETVLVALVTRRGHTMGDFVLGGRELGVRYTIAWPAADLGLDDVPAFTQGEARRVTGRGPWDAAGLAIVDDVVEPRETRARLAAMLPLLVRARAYPPAHRNRDGRVPFR